MLQTFLSILILFRIDKRSIALCMSNVFSLGGFYPLKAEGHAVQVGPKSKQATNAKSPSNNSNSTSTQLQTPAGPGSHQLGRPNSREASHQNLSRPNSACSKASSRVSSARSRQSTQKHSKKWNDETVEGFDVKKFSHYCFDDNVSRHIICDM